MLFMKARFRLRMFRKYVLDASLGPEGGGLGVRVRVGVEADCSIDPMVCAVLVAVGVKAFGGVDGAG